MLRKKISDINHYLRIGKELTESGVTNRDYLKILDAIKSRNDSIASIHKSADNYDMKGFNIPDAINGFFPPLFYRSEYHIAGSRVGTIQKRLAYYALALALEELNIEVNGRCNTDAEVVLNWSYKVHEGRSGNRIYIEHGWLPRNSYQISPLGTNSLSHVAKSYQTKKRSDLDMSSVNATIANLKSYYQISVRNEKINIIKELFKEPFILFALQLSNDANLQYSYSEFSMFYDPDDKGNKKFAQACIDLSASYKINMPIVYKQHPFDPTNPKELKIPSKDFLLSNYGDFRLSELFASGLCKAVISVNSNSLNEALIWGIPGIALGTLVWEESVDLRPFPKTLDYLGPLISTPDIEWYQFLYLQHLFENQWFISDFQNPLMVQEIIKSNGQCIPGHIRYQHQYIFNI